MTTIKKKIKLLILTAALAASFFAGDPVSAEEAQGTDGMEMQAMEPEILEIQLGKEWAGREFRFRTDLYQYPGTVKVGEDGVLRMELGGSRSYTLMLLDPIPAGQPSGKAGPQGTGTPADPSGHESTSPEGDSITDRAQKGSTEQESSGKEDPDTIPKKHIILFAGGMTAATGGLIALHFVQKRRDTEYEDDDGEDE